MINEQSPKKSSWDTYKKLLKESSQYWGIFLFGLIGTIIASGADAALAWLVKPIIDYGLVEQQKKFILFMPLLIIAGFLVRGASLFVSNYFITRVGRSVVMDFRKKLFNNFLKLPASFYDKGSQGQLLSLIIYNTEQISAAITDAVIVILQEGLQLIGLLVVMFLMSWKLSLIFILSAPSIAIVVRYTAKRIRMLSGKVQKTVGDIAHIAEEGIQGYRVIRTFGGENYEREKFNNAAHFNRHCEMKIAVTNSLGTSIVQIMASLPLAFILYIATLPSLHVSIGSFGAIVAAMVRLLTPIRRLTKVNTDIQKGIAAANSIFEVLEEPLEQDTGKYSIERAKGFIEYSDVKFKYPNTDRNILNGINFKIEQGQTIALVGRSGSGKSTIVSLLPRFYDTTSGQILIDGININDYKIEDLRKQFALVSQHVVLFNDTVANNIAYGRFSQATKEEIIEASRAAHILDFINQLPKGFDTLIGENGLLLSGGQRQRIAIARAIFKKAPILILDEATSSLDTESEHNIKIALDNLIRKQTTLVIAHRLSTVENADKILVIENGNVVETGNHQELIVQNGKYAKLYNMQFKQDTD